MTWFDEFAAGFESGFVSQNRVNLRNLYCVSEGPSFPVKIGITADVKNRMIAFQCSTWRPIYLCWHMPGLPRHEAAFKYILRDDIVHGEWFHDRNDWLKTAISVSTDRAALEALINDLAESRGVPAVAVRQQRRPPMQLLTYPRDAA